TRTVSLGAPDHWDYVVVDPSNHRVYVAHGDRLTVVDGESGAIVGQVTGFPGGTHGTAVIDALGRGYTDDGDAGEAGAFDLRTFEVLKRMKAADDADAVTYDPVSGHIFVVDGHPGLVTVIDPKRDTVVATVKADPDLEFAVAGDNGKVYVNGAGGREIIRIDTRANRVDARWPVPDCESPHGLAIDTLARRLFASCLNAVLVVVNIDTGEEVATLPIGNGSDSAVFDPQRKLVFSANGRDGTLSIIWEKTPDDFVPLATIHTAMTARTMGIDPGTGRLYIAAARPQPGATPPAWSKLAPPPVVPGSLELLFLDPRPSGFRP
ncbi:MAG TPA: YncE family protein, partial [Steroidobacteraceae bacterium]|nr:YncE family protein [Steroidobacteraceae bacterium]